MSLPLQPVQPERELRGKAHMLRSVTFARLSLYAFLAMVAGSWAYLFASGDSGLENLFERQTWSYAAGFLSQLMGLQVDGTPAFLQLSQWWETAKLAYRTLAMSVLAMGIAGVGAFLTFMLAARNVSNGDLGNAPSKVGTVFYHLFRGSYAVSRAIPELVWAMLIIFFLSPGILPGAIALGLHNLGIVGRLTAEVVENLDPAPARALRASGAGLFQILLYAVIPQALPHFIIYLLYRWEVVIRTTVVVGFVNAGGLGREFRLNLSYFHYDEVALIIMWYLALVIGVDLLSAWLRRLARFD